MFNHYIQRGDGRAEREHSKTCPMCAGKDFEKNVGTTPDFDEKGWYYTVKFTCKNKKCNNTWTELVRTRT